MRRRRSRRLRVARWTALGVTGLLLAACGPWYVQYRVASKRILFGNGGVVYQDLQEYRLLNDVNTPGWSFGVTLPIWPIAGRDPYALLFVRLARSGPTGPLRLISVPFLAPTFLGIAMTATLFRLDRRNPPGNCRRCGYDLTGNVSGLCPECGTALAGKTV